MPANTKTFPSHNTELCFAKEGTHHADDCEASAMNLRQIEVFRATMLTGSVTEAARFLRVSQPGISRMLAHLELRLGLQLFERRKGKLLPTPEAQALYSEVQQVYGGVKRIQDCAEALKIGERLALRVVASPSMMLEVVPAAVTRLVQEFPAARIYIETLTVPEMARQMVAQEADVAISTVKLDHSLLEAKSIGKWTLVCAFPQGHGFAKQKSVNLKDVVAQPMVAFAPETTQGRFVADWCEQHKATMVSPIQVRSGLNACALVACGAGVAIVDDLTARAYRSDRLSFRPVPKAPTTDILAVMHKQFAPSMLSKTFVKLVAQSLAELRR